MPEKWKPNVAFKHCIACREIFAASRAWSKFCSRKCKGKWGYKQAREALRILRSAAKKIK